MIDAARDIDRPGILRGVATGAVVVGPAAAASAAWARTDGEGIGVLGLLLFMVILVGFGVAGGTTARLGVPLPFTHGALAGLGTFAVVQAAVLAVSAVVGREGGISIAALLFNGLLAASAGMIGAMLVAGRRRPSG